MPSLGADMEAGTLVHWLVKPGDTVKRGDLVAVVETQKGAMEIEVFDDGVVERLLVDIGAKVPVGTPLALIGGPAAPSAGGQPPSAGRRDGPSGGSGEREVTPQVPVDAPAPGSLACGSPPEFPGAGHSGAAGGDPPDGGRAPAPLASQEEVCVTPWVRSSPAARMLAASLGLDLAGVHGTGPHGAVRRVDVEAARRPSPAAPPRLTGFDPAEMRAAIAAAMSRSKREIPHYYLARQVELSRAMDWLAQHNASVSIADRVLPAALLVRAVARAIAEVPELNGYWTDGRFQPASAVHPGVAVSLRGGGLVAPALVDAVNGTLPELMVRFTDLVTRARAGRLRASELSAATLTVSNLGDLGADELLGVIYPPQVALVGLGRIHEVPVAVDGMLAVRPVVRVSLAADHRASDGMRGSRFLARLDALLQSPESL